MTLNCSLQLRGSDGRGLDRPTSLCYLFGVMLAVGSDGLCLMYLHGEQPGRRGMDDEVGESNG